MIGDVGIRGFVTAVVVDYAELDDGWRVYGSSVGCEERRRSSFKFVDVETHRQRVRVRTTDTAHTRLLGLLPDAKVILTRIAEHRMSNASEGWSSAGRDQRAGYRRGDRRTYRAQEGAEVGAGGSGSGSAVPAGVRLQLMGRVGSWKVWVASGRGRERTIYVSKATTMSTDERLRRTRRCTNREDNNKDSKRRRGDEGGGTWARNAAKPSRSMGQFRGFGAPP